MATVALNEQRRAQRPQRVRIGDILIQDKLISQEQLRECLDEQRRSGRRLGKVLVEKGFVSEEQIAEALARQLDLPFLNLKYYNINANISRRLPEAQARRHRAMVLEEQDQALLVAMVDPTDIFAYDELTRQLRREVRIAVVSESMLFMTIDRVYRRTEQITDLARELGEDFGEVVDFGEMTVGLGAEDVPVVKLLQTVFEDATQVKASDIHIEPQEAELQIRFRIDGLLQLQTQADSKIGPPMVQRLKLSSGLDISEKRLPQDGRFNVRIRDQHVDVRISTMPTQYGEGVVLRLLNRTAGVHRLDDIGMPAAMLAHFRNAITRPNGMILVTGPTGSGKTTTLYAALQEINSVDRKIITVEDPVEIRMQGLNQVQVNEKIDLTFSRVLRSVLRHDPDIILVGEIRDLETAQIGMRAAITGHMVMSTLHTRDAASAPLRLIDMGVPRYMVAYAVQAVIAQRLIRLNCETCSEPYVPDGNELEWFRGARVGDDTARFLRGRGCQHCNGSGFLGRTGVYELLDIDAELAALINQDDPAKFVDAANQRMLGTALRDQAGRLVAGGRTTVAEAMRVTAQIED